ncbi:MAG: hypothetical protein WBW41_03550 [Verrucomicrobiia bacterium]
MVAIELNRQCRVMAKRLRDVCGLPESEPLWKAGCGFIVGDLPWSEEKLRAIHQDGQIEALGDVRGNKRTLRSGHQDNISAVGAASL